MLRLLLRCAASQRAGGAAALHPYQPPACLQLAPSGAAAASASTSQRQQHDDTPQARQAMANKLLYRSKQRGFLELDLLVGLWAQENIPRMDMRMLQHFSSVLDQENPDVFKWLTGQVPAPEAMMANPAFKALHSNVQEQLRQRRPEQASAPPGREWVRGWDDNWKTPSNTPVPPGPGAKHSQ